MLQIITLKKLKYIFNITIENNCVVLHLFQHFKQTIQKTNVTLNSFVPVEAYKRKG